MCHLFASSTSFPVLSRLHLTHYAPAVPFDAPDPLGTRLRMQTTLQSLRLSPTFDLARFVRGSMFDGLVLVLLVPSTAFAYLDPGSGALVVQAVVSAVVGTAFTLRRYWIALWLRIFRTRSRAKSRDRNQRLR